MVKSYSIAVAIIFILSGQCLAKTEVIFRNTNFTNYYNDSAEDEQIFYNYNRLRADVNVEGPSKQASLRVLGDIESYLSKSAVGAGNFKFIKDADPNLPFNPFINIMDESAFFSRLHLYRCYTDFKSEKTDLTLGLQRVPFGVCRLWTPTDVFNPIDSTRLEPDERIGVFAANLNQRITNFSYFQVVSNFVKRMNIDKYGIRYKGHHFGADMGCSFVKNESFYMLGSEFESNLFNTGIEVRGEGGFFDDRKLDMNYFSGVVGAEYAFPNNITILGEYFYNGLGFNDKNSYNATRLVNGNWNLGKHYFGGMVTYQINPLVTISLSSILNLTDWSIFNGPAVSYSINDETTLSVGANIFTGTGESEFGEYYSSIYYIKLDAYF
ncbi:MAG: hypothetical protein WC404_02285 [Candidatus Omnitrophota bacterium]